MPYFPSPNFGLGRLTGHEAERLNYISDLGAGGDQVFLKVDWSSYKRQKCLGGIYI